MNAEEILNQKLEERRKIFNNLFSSPEGKIVYKDLRSALVINPELMTRQYTNDDALASHIQVGMRLAFQYIDDFLNLNTINE
jgi:hypothetical protein